MTYCGTNSSWPARNQILLLAAEKVRVALLGDQPPDKAERGELAGVQEAEEPPEPVLITAVRCSSRQQEPLSAGHELWTGFYPDR